MPLPNDSLVKLNRHLHQLHRLNPGDYVTPDGRFRVTKKGSLKWVIEASRQADSALIKNDGADIRFRSMGDAVEKLERSVYDGPINVEDDPTYPPTKPGRKRQLHPRSRSLGSLGKAAESFRLKLGISQETVAKRMESDLTQVGGIERGHRNPSYISLERLAAALETTVSELTTLAGEIADEKCSRSPSTPID